MNKFPVRTCLSFAAVLGIAWAVSGCAYVTHEPVTYHPYPSNCEPTEQCKAVRLKNDQEDAKFTGIRYYLSSLYLLVYTDGKGNLVWKLYQLPDQTKLMVATPTQFFAKTTANFTFTNGVLTQSKSEADSAGAIKAVIGAIEKVLPLMAAAMVPTEATKIPAPKLYKIVFDQGNLKLIGEQSPETVSVTLKPGT